MELLIIATIIVVAWFAGDKRGRERVDEYAAADDRPAAYSALGCNLLFGLVLLALMAFVVFGLGGAPLPR